jgi:hypothetical protein
MKASLRSRLPRTNILLLAATICLSFAAGAAAQVSPNEILNPTLNALEKDNFPQLKTINQAIARMHFPFTFNLSRFVGLNPAQQAEADSRGLEFVRFKDRSVLKVTGNYNAAYSTKQFTRNERAARTFRDVFLPILQAVTQTISPDVNCDSIGFEIAYHVREREQSFDYEGKEILVVVFDRNDAFQMAQVTNDTERQDILNRSLIFLDGQEYGLSILDRDPMVVDTLARNKAVKPNANSTVSTSTSSSASRLVHSSPYVQQALLVTEGDGSTGMMAKQDLSQAKPAATQQDADRLNTQYTVQLDALGRLGAAKFQFVDYDPPAFIVVSKQLALQMTLHNTHKFDPEKASIYKRAALTFDLFLAPEMKDILDKAPDEPAAELYVFSIVNPLTVPGSKERSEAVDFVIPKKLAHQFANSEITNQQLIDKSQVLVNGVRIALTMQLVE